MFSDQPGIQSTSGAVKIWPGGHACLVDVEGRKFGTREPRELVHTEAGTIFSGPWPYQQSSVVRCIV